MISKADALTNTMEALHALRVRQGAPAFIELVEPVGIAMGGAASIVTRLERGWSKSSIHNGAQVVFLILESAASAGIVQAAKFIKYGKDEFQVTDTKAPDEAGGFWMLSVKEA